MNYRHWLALVAIAPMLAAPAGASSSQKREGKQERKARDHDIARQAVLRREVLPLRRILTFASKYQVGEIIEVELKSRSGTVFYDVHVLTSNGVVRELFIDARTGKLIVNQVKD